MRTSEQHLPQKSFSKFLLHIKIKGGFLKVENTLITFISKYTYTEVSLLSCESMHLLITCANSVMLSRCLDLSLLLPLLLACNRYLFFHFFTFFHFFFHFHNPQKPQFNICASLRWEMTGAKHSALEIASTPEHTEFALCFFSLTFL